MNEDTGTNHPNVGAALFEYAHRSGGSLSRYGFEMRVGDNPDFWKARLLMPGAEFLGICYGCFEVEDTGACPSAHLQKFQAGVRVGTTLFIVEIPAETIEEARRRCAEIGGLRLLEDARLTRWEHVKLVARWLWARRPVMRFRGPLDIFL